MQRGRRTSAGRATAGTTTPTAPAAAAGTTTLTPPTAAAGGPDANLATTPAASKRKRSPAVEEERHQRDKAADPPEDVERVVRTTNTCRVVFAALKIELPPGEEIERTVTTTLLDLINRNRGGEEQSLTTLPRAGNILARVNTAVQWKSLEGALAMDPEVPMTHKQVVTINHDGSFPSGRIGKTMSVSLPSDSMRVRENEVAGIATLLTVVLRTRGLVDWSGDVDMTLGSRSYGHLATSGLTEDSLQAPRQLFAAAPVAPLSPQKAIARNIDEMQTPASPLHCGLSSIPASPFSMLSNTTVAIVPQLANKLLTWSEFTYESWTIVREAAKLAISSGTRDHQTHHIHEDVRLVLSATCDFLSGKRGHEVVEGEAYKTLQAMPLDKWVATVDAMMRKIENKPEADLVDLILGRDKAGKPMLSSFKTNFVKYMSQEHFMDRQDVLELIREGIEKNFKPLSDLLLSNEYIRWRRLKVRPQEAIFTVCEILLPYAGVETKPVAGSPGWTEYYCRVCKKNNTHNTKDCTKKESKVQTPTAKPKPPASTEKAKETFFCKVCGPDKNHNTADCKRKPTKPIGYSGRTDPDGKKGDVPKNPTYLCTICKIPGHFKEWCSKV